MTSQSEISHNHDRLDLALTKLANHRLATVILALTTNQIIALATIANQSVAIAARRDQIIALSQSDHFLSTRARDKRQPGHASQSQASANLRHTGQLDASPLHLLHGGVHSAQPHANPDNKDTHTQCTHTHIAQASHQHYPYSTQTLTLPIILTLPIH